MLTRTAYVAVRKSDSAPAGEWLDLSAASGDRSDAEMEARKAEKDCPPIAAGMPLLRIARVRVTEEPAGSAATAPAGARPSRGPAFIAPDLFNGIDAPWHSLIQPPIDGDTEATAMLRHLRDIAAAIEAQRIPASAINWRAVRDLAGAILANETGEG